jgi:hypothetical protein
MVQYYFTNYKKVYNLTSAGKSSMTEKILEITNGMWLFKRSGNYYFRCRISVPIGKIKTDFLFIMIHYRQQAVNSLHQVKFKTLTFSLYRNVALVMHTRILCLRITKGLKGTVSPDLFTLILFLQTIYLVLLITYRMPLQFI